MMKLTRRFICSLFCASILMLGNLQAVFAAEREAQQATDVDSFNSPEGGGYAFPAKSFWEGKEFHAHIWEDDNDTQKIALFSHSGISYTLVAINQTFPNCKASTLLVKSPEIGDSVKGNTFGETSVPGILYTLVGGKYRCDEALEKKEADSADSEDEGEDEGEDEDEDEDKVSIHVNDDERDKAHDKAHHPSYEEL